MMPADCLNQFHKGKEINYYQGSNNEGKKKSKAKNQVRVALSAENLPQIH